MNIDAINALPKSPTNGQILSAVHGTCPTYVAMLRESIWMGYDSQPMLHAVAVELHSAGIQWVIAVAYAEACRDALRAELADERESVMRDLVADAVERFRDALVKHFTDGAANALGSGGKAIGLAIAQTINDFQAPPEVPGEFWVGGLYCSWCDDPRRPSLEHHRLPDIHAHKP